MTQYPLRRWRGAGSALGAALLVSLATFACGRSGYPNASGGDGEAADDVPPVITLLGDPTVILFAGEPWWDPGATARDQVDGDLSAQIIVDDPVSATTAGTYTVTYDVSDAAGNAAEQVSRTVIVREFALTVVSVPSGASSFDVSVELNGAGWVHYALFASAVSPTAAEVAAEAASPAAAIRSGTISVPVANRTERVSHTGLADDTSYWLYLVGEGDRTGLEPDSDVHAFQLDFPVRHGVLTFDSPSQPGVTVFYWAYLPEAHYKRSTGVFPTLMFLHGWGERGPDDGSQVDLVLANSFPEMIEQGQEFDFIILAPHCTTGAWDCWNWSPTIVEETLSDAESRFRVDAARVYVTGLSTGGGGTVNYAMAHPTRAAAIMPACSISVNATNICNLVDVPVWAFHNQGDPTQSNQNTINFLDALWACDPAPSPAPLYTEYPASNHNCWDATYQQTGAPFPTTVAYDGTTPTPDDIFDWLLSHRR